MLFSLFEIARSANHPTGGRLGPAHHPGIRRLTYRLDQAAWTHFSLSLTSPSGLKYITNVVQQGDSSGGAGIRRVTEKGNTYPSSF